MVQRTEQAAEDDRLRRAQDSIVHPLQGAVQARVGPGLVGHQVGKIHAGAPGGLGFGRTREGATAYRSEPTALTKRPRARTQANRTPTTQLGCGPGPRQRDSSNVRRCRPAAQDRSSPSRPTPRLRTAVEARRTASRHPTCPSAPFTFSATCQQSGTSRDVFRNPRLRDARHATYRQGAVEPLTCPIAGKR